VADDGWGVALVAGVLAGVALASCGDAEPCARPLQECGGLCVDIASDVRHCGACGVACGGQTCAGGRCAADPGVSCTTRAGGAFVTFEVCGDAVKTWVVSGAFVDEAAAILGGAPRRVPTFGLASGADCDDQWSYHPVPATAAFIDVAAVEAACDACPAVVQGELSRWLGEVGRWCPSSARVVAVDRRP